MRSRSRKKVAAAEVVKEFLLAAVIVIPLLLLLAHGWTLQEELDERQLALWKAENTAGGEAH